jgi:hypothetical protein
LENDSQVHKHRSNSSSSSSSNTALEVSAGIIPPSVTLNNKVRSRADSNVTFVGDMETTSDHEETTRGNVVRTTTINNGNNTTTAPPPRTVQQPESSSDSDDNDDEPEATSTAEQQSLLYLAAEHDRVDILQAILASTESSLLLDHREQLLRDGVPPLHVAMSYGSVNATNCLLRMVRTVRRSVCVLVCIAYDTLVHPWKFVSPFSLDRTNISYVLTSAGRRSKHSTQCQ